MSKEDNLGLFGLLGEFSQGAKTIGKAVKAVRGGSLSEYLGSTAVEPVCLVESNLAHAEITHPLLMTALETYSCMYLQVFSRLTAVGIDAVKVTRTLERLATDRNVLDSIAALESGNKDFLSIALESDKKARYSEMKVSDKHFAEVTDNKNLSVGKLLNLTVSNGKEKLDVPVQVRLRTKLTPPSLVRDIFKANYADVNMLSRIRLYSLEEITLSEMLTGSDIIEAQERVRLADKDGVVRSHFIESMKNAGYSALTGEIPINRASGVTVINASTVPMIEREIRGRLDRFKDREKFFDGTATMMLIVVDQEEEMVDFYYRGFREGSTETFRTIMKATAGKGGSSDLTPVVKDLLQGQVPSF